MTQALRHIHERYAKENTRNLGIRISREDLATIVGL